MDQLFQWGRKNPSDYARSRRPSISCVDKSLKHVRSIVLSNHRLIVGLTADELNFGKSAVHTISEHMCGLMHHDNAPAHSVVIVYEFLTHNSITARDHPLYSSDLECAISFCSRNVKWSCKNDMGRQ